MLHYCTSDRERKKSEIERSGKPFFLPRKKKHQNTRKKANTFTHSQQKAFIRGFRNKNGRKESLCRKKYTLCNLA